MSSQPVNVNQFARVFVESPEQLPPDAVSKMSPGGPHFLLDLDSVDPDEASPIVKRAAERFEVEVVKRVETGDLYKERVYVDNPSDVPDGYKVQTGKYGGIYYETGVQSVGSQDTGPTVRNVVVVHSEDVDVGDEIVFESPAGDEVFAEIVEVSDGSDGKFTVEYDGERHRATAGTYSVDQDDNAEKSLIGRRARLSDGSASPDTSHSRPTRPLSKEWVSYTGPRGGEGWMNRRTGEVRYQDKHPERAEEQSDPESPDFDPTEPPEDGFARGWEEPVEPHRLLEGQTIEYWDGEEYGYGEVTAVGEDSVTVESEGGQEAEVETVTAVESNDWDPTDVPDVEFMDDPDPETFMSGVEEKIEEDPEMAAFLSVHEPEHFEDHEIVMTADGKAGAAVSPDGDAQNLFSLDDSEKGAGRAAMKKAFEAGAIKLDCYDGYLRDLYSDFGFRETARMEFDPEYAHEEWNFEEYGHPDVVFMHYDPQEELELTDDYIGPGEWGDAKEESGRKADTSARSPPKERGVRERERGTDTGSGEESGRPVDEEKTDFSSARYSPETSDEDEEWPHEQFEKDANPWTYYIGPEGGEGWQNLATGEKRYQQQRPGPAPEGGDGYGDWLADGWSEPPDDINELEQGQTVEIHREGEGYLLGEVDVMSDDVALVETEEGDKALPGQSEDEEITAVEEFELQGADEFEVGEDVYLHTPGLEPEHPNYFNEHATVTDITNLDGQALYEVSDDNGTVIQEFYAQELRDVVEDESEDDESESDEAASPFEDGEMYEVDWEQDAMTAEVEHNEGKLGFRITGGPYDGAWVTPDDIDNMDDVIEEADPRIDGDPGPLETIEDEIAGLAGDDDGLDFDPIDAEELDEGDVVEAVDDEGNTEELTVDSQFGDYAIAENGDYIGDDPSDSGIIEWAAESVVSGGSDGLSEEEQEILDTAGVEVGDQFNHKGKDVIVTGTTTLMQDGSPSHVEIELLHEDTGSLPVHPNTVPDTAGSSSDAPEEDATEDEGDGASETEDDESASESTETDTEDDYDATEYDPDDVQEWKPLSAANANHGNSMDAKEVAVMPDGSEMVHTNLNHPDINTEDGRRQMSGYEVQKELLPEGTVDHSADFMDGYFANEVAPGVDAKDAGPDRKAAVDESDFYQMAAAQVIIGNTDCHQNNVKVDEDGNLYPFDLDRAGGDIMSPWAGNLPYKDSFDRIMGELNKTATALGIDMDREKVMHTAEDLVFGISDQKQGSMVSDAEAWSSEFAGNIEKNMQIIAAGDYEGKL